MPYLTLAEMRDQAPVLRETLARLMDERAFAAKKGALQWRFFKAVLERMLDPGRPEPFADRDRVQLAQLKFEAADRLRRYYLRPGKPVRFLFSLVHRSALGAGFEAEDWPTLGGYLLLVQDVSAADPLDPWDPARLRPYLERVVSEAVMAEFHAYAALPERDPEALDPWFVRGSPAQREILGTLARRQAEGCVLSHPLNPSTVRIQNVSVRSLTPVEALLATTEYWYLCWDDQLTQARVYTYRETNQQLYILQPEGGSWKVFQNLRPMPRSVAPHRKIKS